MIFSVYAYYCGTGEAVETAMANPNPNPILSPFPSSNPNQVKTAMITLT